MQTTENVTERITRNYINNNDNPLNTEISILPKTFQNFTYSKKHHISLFKEKGYDKELFGKEIDSEDFKLKDYQSLLIFAFIKKSIPKGARILEIGDVFLKVFNKSSNDYELWSLSDPTDLTKDLLTESNTISISSIKNNNIKLKNYYTYFDFVFSISAFEGIKQDKERYNNILFNLNRLTKPGAYSIHSFNFIFDSNLTVLNRLVLFLNSNCKNENKIQNKFTNPSKIKSLPGLFFTKTPQEDLNKVKSNRRNTIEILKSAACNILLRKNINLLPRMTQTRSSEFLNKQPAYIFHHLIKCGGSSVVNELFNWFNLEFDHLVDSNKINEYVKFRYNIENINSETCLVSHFDHQGAYIHQRYPEIYTKKNIIKTFIFVRDPMKFLISLYYYIRNQGRFQNITLLNQLKYNRNFLSGLIPCDESNYKEVLDRYFFIGIVEHMQESFDKLAKLLGKKKFKVPVMNQSIKDSQISEVTPEVIEEFKENNKLDYKVYHYCLEKFNAIKP